MHGAQTVVGQGLGCSAPRRGAGEVTEAIESYEKAHELDPTCDEYQSEAAKLAAPPPRRPPPRRPPPPLNTVAMAPEPSVRSTRRIYGRGVLAGVVVYATSFTGVIRSWAFKYKSAVRWAVLSALLHAYRAHGVPKLSADYARRLFTDPHAQRLFGVCILRSSGPGELVWSHPRRRRRGRRVISAACYYRLRRNVKTRPLYETHSKVRGRPNVDPG